MLTSGSCSVVSRWTLAIDGRRHRIPKGCDEAAEPRPGERRYSPLPCSILGRRSAETSTLGSGAARIRPLPLRQTSLVYLRYALKPLSKSKLTDISFY